MKRDEHFSMIRSFHLVDLFRLANAFCGVGALFALMRYLKAHDVMRLLFRAA
ncbi:MAG: hypothetical protein ACREUA_11095 [Burkholderiales bacterium]